MPSPAQNLAKIDTLRAKLHGMNRSDCAWNKVSAELESEVSCLVRQSYAEAKVYEAEMGKHFDAEEDHGEAVDQLRGRLCRVGLHPNTVNDAARKLANLLGIEA